MFPALTCNLRRKPESQPVFPVADAPRRRIATTVGPLLQKRKAFLPTRTIERCRHLGWVVRGAGGDVLALLGTGLRFQTAVAAENWLLRKPFARDRERQVNPDAHRIGCGWDWFGRPTVSPGARP